MGHHSTRNQSTTYRSNAIHLLPREDDAVGGEASPVTAHPTRSPEVPPLFKAAFVFKTIKAAPCQQHNCVGIG